MNTIEMILEKYIYESDDDIIITKDGDTVKVNVNRSALEEIFNFSINVLKLPAYYVNDVISRVFKKFKYVATKEGRMCMMNDYNRDERELCYLKMRLIKKEYELEVLYEIEKDLQLSAFKKYKQFERKRVLLLEIRQLRSAIDYWEKMLKINPDWVPSDRDRIIKNEILKRKIKETYN